MTDEQFLKELAVIRKRKLSPEETLMAQISLILKNYREAVKKSISK